MMLEEEELTFSGFGEVVNYFLSSVCVPHDLKQALGQEGGHHCIALLEQGVSELKQFLEKCKKRNKHFKEKDTKVLFSNGPASPFKSTPTTLKTNQTKTNNNNKQISQHRTNNNQNRTVVFTEASTSHPLTKNKT